ncbi:MAG: hypothetical protein ACKO9Z_13910 [Planctomycetota bacterium]
MEVGAFTEIPFDPPPASISWLKMTLSTPDDSNPPERVNGLDPVNVIFWLEGEDAESKISILLTPLKEAVANDPVNVIEPVKLSNEAET